MPDPTDAANPGGRPPVLDQQNYVMEAFQIVPTSPPGIAA